MYPANNSTVEESGANENSTIAASGTHKNSTIEGSSVPLNSTVAGSGGLVLSMLAKDAFKVGKVIYRCVPIVLCILQPVAQCVRIA